MSLISNNYNTNNYNIGLQGAMPQRPETPKTEEKVQQQPVQPERAQVSANDVLQYMANSSIMLNAVATAKKIDPAQYISSTRQADIAESMRKFEATFEENLNSVYSEVPNIDEATAWVLASKLTENEVA